MKQLLTLAVILAAVHAVKPLGKTVTLSNGVVMPSVGLGSSGHCHPDPPASHECTSYTAAIQAINNGYRSFHNALSYGGQAGLGQAVQDQCSTGSFKRRDFFLMSMVPKYLMGYNETIAAVHASLHQLQLDYLDLVMIHHRAADLGEWPRNVSKMEAFPDGWSRAGSPVSSGLFSLWEAPSCSLKDPTWQLCQDETWRALVDLKKMGILRAIGVSNWMLPNLKRMKQLGQELPAVNQIEQHIGWHDSELVQWCAANGILVQAASPLSRGVILSNPVVLAVAKQYSRSPAQIALRFLLELGVSPIPKATQADYQLENLHVFDFQLNATDVERLGNLVIPCRGNPGDGLQKCWADPAVVMCGDGHGRVFHCP